MLKSGFKMKSISETIGVAESTLYRELSCNKQKRDKYNAKYAQMLADERLKEGHYKRKFTAAMQRIVDEKIKMDWSPEQITNWCKNNGTDMVSHERIYQYIWED
jgi:IS30 family transposase